MNATSTTNTSNLRPKALALLSGGLDSALAACIVRDCGVDVIGLHLSSPFGCKLDVEKMAKQIGIPLLVREKGEAYLEMLKAPKYGYGRAANPCIDCRIYMFEFAEKVRTEIAADFLITGEVLGQRPMSQIRKAITVIDDETRESDRILRPLSAHRFDPTLPERMGWVNRDHLFKLAGRGRKTQLALAKQYGITEFPNPGGGCVLTEVSFSGKVRDFLKHDHQGKSHRTDEAALLLTGRHFRYQGIKIIVGRNQADNAALVARTAELGAELVEPDGFKGPLALALQPLDTDTRTWVGRLIRRYSGGAPSTGPVPLRAKRLPAGDFSRFTVDKPLTDEELEPYRL